VTDATAHYAEEKTFVLRFTLRAEFGEDYEGDEDGYEWFADWENVKPRVLRAVLDQIRDAGGWRARVLNRGAPSDLEVELLLERAIAKPVQPPPNQGS
jgi:hypothetical protein